MVDWLQETGEEITWCLVGEPTSVSCIGDMIKVGRRGSLNAMVTATGIAGHVAYPDQCMNPLDLIVQFYNKLKSVPLDQGNEGLPTVKPRIH
jgi:succinyl-diaminopimelate desuccinylase